MSKRVEAEFDAAEAVERLLSSESERPRQAPPPIVLPSKMSWPFYRRIFDLLISSHPAILGAMPTPRSHDEAAEMLAHIDERIREQAMELIPDMTESRRAAELEDDSRPHRGED